MEKKRQIFIKNKPKFLFFFLPFSPLKAVRNGFPNNYIITFVINSYYHHHHQCENIIKSSSPMVDVNLFIHSPSHTDNTLLSTTRKKKGRARTLLEILFSCMGDDN